MSSSIFEKQHLTTSEATQIDCIASPKVRVLFE